MLSGNFQFKFRPFIPLFHAGNPWLPSGTHVNIGVDLPRGDLSRYMIISNKGGGADSAKAPGSTSISVELLDLDLVYPTNRMKKDFSKQVSTLYFDTWGPRLIQKLLYDYPGTLEFLHNVAIPRQN